MNKTLLLTLIILGMLVSCSKENSIENNINPEACFCWVTKTNEVRAEILFSNCSENSTHYYWTFGDGETSTQSEPYNIFKKQGTY